MLFFLSSDIDGLFCLLSDLDGLIFAIVGPRGVHFMRYLLLSGLDVLIYAGFFIVGACWSTGGLFIVGISTCCFFTRAGYAWMCCIFYCGISTCQFFIVACCLPDRPSRRTIARGGWPAHPPPWPTVVLQPAGHTTARPPLSLLSRWRLLDTRVWGLLHNQVYLGIA